MERKVFFIMKKRMLSMMLAGVLALSMAGCGGSSSDGDGSGSSSDSAAASDEDVIELTLSHNWVEGSNGNGYIWQFIEEYEEEHPNVKITTQALGHDDYEVKIATGIAAGDVADIFEYKGGMLVNVARNNLAIPLNEVLEEDPEWADSFRDGLFNDLTTADGEILGFPVEFAITTVLYYNEEILKEVGYDAPPEKWEDFLVLCDDLNAAGYTPVAFGNAAGWPVESDMFSKYANNMTGTDWFWDIKYGNGGSFTDPEFIDSLNMLKEASDRNMFNEDINTLEYSLGQQLYFDGKAAMLMDGSYAIRNIMDGASQEIQDATQVSFFPYKDGGKGDAKAVCGGAGWGMGINSKLEGEKREIAIDFCKRYFGPDQAEVRLKNGAFPATKVDDYSFCDPLQQKYLSTIVENYTDLAQCYSVHLPTNLINVFYNGLQDFMAGNLSAEDYAAEIQAEYERTELK